MIEPDDLLAMIDAGGAPVILDVRSKAEFEAGHIPGAQHVPFWLLPFRTATLPGDRSGPLVVYCGHGPRARFAAAALERHGFTSIRLLHGHMSGWRRRRLREEPAP